MDDGTGTSQGGLKCGGGVNVVRTDYGPWVFCVPVHYVNVV